MQHANGELGDRLAALRTDFAALGTRAAGAAEALVATLPPPTLLLDDLSAARGAFDALRSAMLQQAGALSLVFDAEDLGTLRDLEPVLAAITAAEEHRARVAAWEEAREEAFGVLDRVIGLIHREDKSLPALGEAPGRARELRAALSAGAPTELEHETRCCPARRGPLPSCSPRRRRNALDDARGVLQDAITSSQAGRSRWPRSAPDRARGRGAHARTAQARAGGAGLAARADGDAPMVPKSATAERGAGAVTASPNRRRNVPAQAVGSPAR